MFDAIEKQLVRLENRWLEAAEKAQGLHESNEALKRDIALMVMGHHAPSHDALSDHQWWAIEDAYRRHTPSPEPEPPNGEYTHLGEVKQCQAPCAVCVKKLEAE